MRCQQAPLQDIPTGDSGLKQSTCFTSLQLKPAADTLDHLQSECAELQNVKREGNGCFCERRLVRLYHVTLSNRITKEKSRLGRIYRDDWSCICLQFFFSFFFLQAPREGDELARRFCCLNTILLLLVYSNWIKTKVYPEDVHPN